MVAKRHEHEYLPLYVGYMHTANNLPDYFLARFVCVIDDCDAEYVGITEAKEA